MSDLVRNQTKTLLFLFENNEILQVILTSNTNIEPFETASTGKNIPRLILLDQSCSVAQIYWR